LHFSVKTKRVSGFVRVGSLAVFLILEEIQTSVFVAQNVTLFAEGIKSCG
jgi:hypothetical protein